MWLRRVEFLEKAIANRQAFRELAQRSMNAHQYYGSLKRTNVTSSGVGVSPDTAKARPSSKVARKKLFFSCKLIKQNIHNHCNKVQCNFLAPERPPKRITAPDEYSTAMASYASHSRPPLAPIGKEKKGIV